MRRISTEKLKDVLDRHYKWLLEEKGGVPADLSYTDLSKADLSYARLELANLYHADLSNANLSKTNLCGADLSNADLSGANLSGSWLYAANLSKTRLYETNLSNATLYYTNLSEANLQDANILGADFSCAVLKDTILDGKMFVSFRYQKEVALYAGTDKIRIGCLTHPISHWALNFEKIGTKYGYSSEQIEKYGEFIKKCEMDYNSAKVCN